MAKRCLHVRLVLFSSFHVCSKSDSFLKFPEVLDEYLATLNVRWSNDKGMALIPLVPHTYFSFENLRFLFNIVTRLNFAGQGTSSFFPAMSINLLVKFTKPT